MSEGSNEVVVLVLGKPSSGKSAIAQRIEAALENEEIRYEVEDGTKGNRANHEVQQERLHALKKKNTRVRIKTGQVSRKKTPAQQANRALPDPEKFHDD